MRGLTCTVQFTHLLETAQIPLVIYDECHAKIDPFEVKNVFKICSIRSTCTVIIFGIKLTRDSTIGLDFRGPNTFGVRALEKEKIKKKQTL